MTHACYRSALEVLAADFNPLSDYRPPSRRGKNLSTAGGLDPPPKSPSKHTLRQEARTVSAAPLQELLVDTATSAGAVAATANVSPVEEGALLSDTDQEPAA